MKNLTKGLQKDIDNLKTLISNPSNFPADKAIDIDRVVKNIEQAIIRFEHEESRIKHVLNSSAVAIWDWNIQTGETTFNKRWVDIIGHPLHENTPTHIESWKKHMYADDIEGFNQVVETFLQDGCDFYTYENRLQHKDGHLVWVHNTGQVVEWDEQGQPLRMIGVNLDITELKKTQDELLQAKQQADKAIEELSEQAVLLQTEVARRRDIQSKLDHIAKYDPLTNLPNRTLLFHHADKLLASARRYGHSVAVMFIGLDGFKTINNNNDHKVGDSVLVETSIRLNEVIRDVDMISRLGGDEFVVLLSNWNQLSDVEAIAERLLKTIKQPIESVDIKEQLSASVGISIFPDNAGYFKDLLSLADKAMYACKKAGKDRFAFTP